jgi:hypothetical protein
VVNRKKIAAIVLWVLVAIFVKALISELALFNLNPFRDFNGYYLPALLLRLRTNPYLVGPHWADTPSWIILLRPLTFASEVTAYRIWFCINVVALGISLFLLLRDVRRLDFYEKWILAGILLMYPPIATTFWFGQSAIILLLILTLFFHEYRQGHDAVAGILLACAAVLRAYPVALLGYVVARRRWRLFAYTTVGCIVLMLLTTVIAGPSVVATYVGNVLAPNTLNQPTALLQYPRNLSVGRLVRFILLNGAGVAEDSVIATTLAFASQAALLAFAFVVTWYNSEERLNFALWIITVTMCSPIVWKHFLTCFVIPYVVLAEMSYQWSAIVAGIGSYAILAFSGDLKGYPIPSMSQILTQEMPGHRRLVHAIPGICRVMSVTLLYFSICWEIRHYRTSIPLAEGGAASGEVISLTT